MRDAQPNCWPKVSPDVPTPETVLRQQAALLYAHTGGQLRATVVQSQSQGDVFHHLEAVVAGGGRAKAWLLTAVHRAAAYPVQVDAAIFHPRTAGGRSLRLPRPTWPPADTGWRAAHGHETFLELVREVLRSDEVRAALDSLLAGLGSADSVRDTVLAETPVETWYDWSDRRQPAG